MIVITSISGDAYRYTLQPVYAELDRTYSCHLRRSRPETLYQLWFYVSVPGTNFETPRVHFQFPASSTGSNFGRHEPTEFLTVEHSAGIELDDDVILTGRRITKTTDGELGGNVNSISDRDADWSFTVTAADASRHYDDSNRDNGFVCNQLIIHVSELGHEMFVTHSSTAWHKMRFRYSFFFVFIVFKRKKTYCHECASVTPYFL